MNHEILVWDHKKQKCVPKNQAPQVAAGPSVIGDIQEVRSPITNEMFSSRKYYQDHIKAHECEIVGNDFNNQPMTRETPDVPGLEQDIKRAMGEG